MVDTPEEIPRRDRETRQDREQSSWGEALLDKGEITTLDMNAREKAEITRKKRKQIEEGFKFGFRA